MAVTPAARGGLGADIILPILAIIAVVCRYLARKTKSLPLKEDDWTILAALIPAVGVCIAGIYGACTGLLGVSFLSMTPESYLSFRKLLFADVIICHFLFGLIKISVVLFTKRIFVTPRFCLVANIVLVLISMFMIAAFFAVLFGSHDVSGFWTTPKQLDGTQFVLNFPALLTAFAVLDIALDILVLSLPIPVIKSLHMTTRKKFYLAGIFLLGAFCFVSSTVRFYCVVQLLSFNTLNPDRARELSDSNALWAHIEACASIVAACLPTYGPLFGGVRSLESLVGSFRSLFSIGSRSKLSISEQRTKSKQTNSQSSADDKRAWHELRSKATCSSATGGTHSLDLEAHSQRSDTILVQKTFASEREQY